MTKSRAQLTIVLMSAALVLALILTVSPETSVVANEVSGEIYGIDVLGITMTAKDLPEQQFAAQ